MRRVEVLWRDSMTLNAGGWASQDEHEAHANLRALSIRSIGYLVKETDDLLLIAQSGHDEDDNDELCAAFVIPKAAVYAMVELGPKEATL